MVSEQVQIAGVLLVVLLLGTAGLFGLAADDVGDEPDGSSEATSHPQDDTSAVEPEATERSSTPTVTPEPTPDNPWNKAVVHAAINDTAAPDRSPRPEVRDAVEYWNRNIHSYTDYNFTLDLTNRTEPDVEFRLVNDRIVCGTTVTIHSNTLGCSPLLNGTQPRRTETIELLTNQSNASLDTTTRHEIGHLLGLDHTDEPYGIMAQNHSAITLPDARNQTNPWKSDEIVVSVDWESFEDDRYRREVADEVDYAVNYYQKGADGNAPEDVSFRFAEENRYAEITVLGNEKSSECGLTSSASAPSYYGTDKDGDDWLEDYTEMSICTNDIDTDTLSWHVGRWIADAIGLRGADLPSLFEDADYETRSGQWHGFPR